ncbi:MAG TPA: PLP-dependent aminotransferase family protein [Pseudonocardia sp.]|nr:PLP-dependent aminotransferase family protein [Pseudonocardia sp.]
MFHEIDKLVTLDRGSGYSLRDQIVEQLTAAMRDGVLVAGDPLPSTRSLAAALGVARTTVVACYLRLEGEGWLHSSHGSGTFVVDRPDESAGAGPVEPEPAPAEPPAPMFDLVPGNLDPSVLATPRWRAAFRPSHATGTVPPAQGLPALRAALAEHLRSARGLACRPEEIVLCAGTSEGLAVLGLALGWPGHDVAVEDPGYPAVGMVLRRIGARVLPIAVDGAASVLAGLRNLPAPPAAVYLTPSHQYPLGHRLHEDERRDLLAWSADTGAVLLEDDYDGEFRFGVAPLPSLAGLDPAADTVYLGTLSKVLDPALRIAYLRVPPQLLDAVLASRADLGSTTSESAQEAVVRMLRSGELSRHIARARRLYADRRRAVLQELAAVPAVTGIRGTEAGLHLVVELAPAVRTAVLVAEAAERGVHVDDLDSCRAAPDPDRPALVVGYGALAPTRLRLAIERLASCPELTRPTPQ